MITLGIQMSRFIYIIIVCKAFVKNLSPELCRLNLEIMFITLNEKNDLLQSL